MADYGFQNLERIGRQTAGAALAAGIAAVEAGLEDLKDEFKGDAPVGSGKVGTRGAATPGGRTKSSIGWAYPRVDTISLNQFGGAAQVEAQIVMAPQGIYHSDGVRAQRIAPREQAAMVFLDGNKWFAVGPGLRGGFTQSRSSGFARAGIGTQFVKRAAINKPAQQGSGWIDSTGRRYRPSLAIAQAVWFRIGSKKVPRPAPRDIPDRAFAYSARRGAWGSGYRNANDQKLRNNWRSAATRAATVWRNQVAKALSRIR